ncbi:caspase domain-containing protein [Aspergillus navahoensis]
MTNNTPPTHYALIIGINYYPNDRSLKGAVRDAHAVQEYLSLLQTPTPVDCRVLTATSPLPGGPSNPAEDDPERWPTHANVVSSLKNIIQQVKQGDRVYFHFSGHGTVTPATAPAAIDTTSSGSSRELSLLLYENDSVGSSYLRGRHLAGAFQKLVEKGVLVTVVLDCCFSGSVVRNGRADSTTSSVGDIDTVLRRSGARFIDYSPETDDSTARNHDPRVVDWDHTSRASSIDRSQTNWLLDPQGYTILTACGPYEIAHEIEVQGGRRGALSYFLLASLHGFSKYLGDTGTPGGLSHQALHEHIRTKFHISAPWQTPMRYGNTQLSFFGGIPDQLVGKTGKGDVSVYRKDSGSFCLGAGEAHGVCVGDEYAILSAKPNSYSPARGADSVILRVKVTRPFDSDLEDISKGRAAMDQGIGTVASARPISCLSPFKIRVQLAHDIPHKSRWMDAAAGLRFVELSADDNEAKACTFRVQATNQNEYAVVDPLGMSIDGLPTIPISCGAGAGAAEGEAKKAVVLLLNVLQHVATFKYFESIENKLPSQSFLDSFAITSGAPGPDYRVRHGETWRLTIENRSGNLLYVAIFSFDVHWEVCNIVSASGGDDYLVIPPKEANGPAGRITLPLAMEVPTTLQRLGKKQCRDIIKVFVTSRPIAFPSMILPSLSLSGAASRTDTSQRESNRLDAFLSELTASSRDASQARHGYGEWAARNFIIRTVIDEKD